ncbi:F-box/FBD/LRR-repeat protein At5g22700-like [Silene latifolia]|uniref:F-box/FBD/LRR-repeat protein At5g22700-like n=1 Tax=Silene latifolia TaxID=37657 RepID=UPI003D772C17
MADCTNSKHGQFNFMDRLSDLPDFIIHHIISYLYTEEAYRTSVLSKRWNQIFATNPILDFCLYNFPTDMIPRYLEYIDARMQKISKENLRITKFRLDLRNTDLLLGCKVDEWLEIALRNQVAEIVLEGPAKYKLPRFLFCAKSLRHLHCDNVEIPYYEAVQITPLSDLLFHIVSSCLLLKKLSLSFCPGFKNIVIPRHRKLEYLYIVGDVPVDGRVILETSSLMTFHYNINGQNVSWPIISNSGLLRNLRNLLVTGLSITGWDLIRDTQWMVKLEHTYREANRAADLLANRGISSSTIPMILDTPFYDLREDLAKLLQEELTSLEKLEFIGCQMLTNIRISHTQLKQIGLYECDNLLNVVIDAPNLKKFKFDGYIEPPLSITIHSQANCNIHVVTSPCYFDTDGFFILKKLLKGLNSCNVLKIFLYDDSSEPLLNELVDMVKCLTHPLKRIEVEETNSGSDSLDVKLRLCW